MHKGTIMTEQVELTFEQFLSEIDRLALAEGCELPYTQQTGAECWKDQYEFGMTPGEAWREEKSYGAEG